MALGGWGLTPGTMEANVTRSLGGGYGSVGSSPGTISDMTRNKYTAGLQAKKAKEAIDLTRTAETNRQSEAAQQFGLQTEKFGFEKASTEKDWAYRQKQLALQKAATEGGWSQQELDRALREEQLIQSGSQFDRNLTQSGSQFDRNLAQSGSQYDRNLAQRSSEYDRSLAQSGSQYDRNLEQNSSEFNKNYLMKQGQYDQSQSNWQSQFDRDQSRYDDAQSEAEKARMLSSFGGSSGSGSYGGWNNSSVNQPPKSMMEARLKNKWYEAMGLPSDAINEFNKYANDRASLVATNNNRYRSMPGQLAFAQR